MTLSLSNRVFPGLLLVLLLALFILLPTLLTHLHHLPSLPPSRSPTPHSEEIPLTLLENGLYAVPILVGTPGQPCQAIVDTGASLSWVVDNQHLYESGRSSTHKSLNRSLYKHYRTGEWIKAAMSTDAVSVGHLHISAVHLGLVTETNCDQHSSALLAISPRHYEGSVVDRIKHGRRLQYSTIQWINHGDSAGLVFGVDPRQLSNTFFVSCLRSRWIVPASVCAGERMVAVEALIDTASTHIFLPDHLVRMVRQDQLVSFDKKTEMARYIGTPDQLELLPTFTVGFVGEHRIQIPPRVYVDPKTQQVLLACLKTTFSSAPYTAILGLPFIRNCCRSVVLDFGRLSVGFTLL